MSMCSFDKPLLSVYYEPDTTKGSEESQVNQTQQSFPLPAWSYGSPFFCQRNEATQLVHGSVGTTGHGFQPPLQGPPTYQAKGSLVFWSSVTVKERHLSPFHQGKKKMQQGRWRQKKLHWLQLRKACPAASITRTEGECLPLNRVWLRERRASDRPRVESYVHRLLARWPWTSDLASFGHSFHVHKMRMTVHNVFL